MILTQKPGNGFSLSKVASPVSDAYNTYQNSVVNDDQIWDALTTEAGRQAIGA